MTEVRKAATGFAWNQFAKIVEFALQFLLSIVLARGLGSFQYGIYVKLTTVAVVLVSVGSLGLEEAIARFLPETSFITENRISFFLRKLLVVRLISVFALCSLVYLARNSLSTFGLGELRSYWNVTTIYFSALAISNLLSGVFYAQLQTELVFAVRTASSVLILAGASVLLKLGYGISELMVVVGTSWLAATIVYLARIKKYLNQPPETFKDTHIWKYALVMWLLAQFNQVLGKQSDVLILSYFSVNPAQIGYYSIAYGLAGLIKTLLISGLSEVGIPIAVKASEQGSARLAQAWELLTKITTVLSLPFLFFAILFAQHIVSVIYSDTYLESAFYLQLFGLFGLIERLLGGGTSYSVLCVLKKERVVLGLRFAIGIANLVLNVLLVQSMGTMGVVVGTGFCGTVIIFLETVILSQYLVFRYPWRFMSRILISIVAGGVCTFGIVRIIAPTPSLLQLALTGTLYCAIVGFAIYLLKPLDKVDANIISLVNARLGTLASILSTRE